MAISSTDLRVLRELVARAEHVDKIRGNSIPLRARHSLATHAMIAQDRSLEDEASNMQSLYVITQKAREAAR